MPSIIEKTTGKQTGKWSRKDTPAHDPSTYAHVGIVGADQPPVGYRWDFDAEDWRPPTEAEQLPQAKIEKAEAIDARTGEIIAAGFAFDGKQLSLSANAQTNYLGLQLKINAVPYPFAITTLNDSAYQVADAATMQQLLDAAFTAKETALATGRALKVAAGNASTLTELNAIHDNR